MTKLARTLGFPEVFCLAAGAMISSGLFVLPGLAYAMAGPAVVGAYALGGLMAIPAMLAQAELCTAMPRSGGSYFFIERAMGALPGTLAGLANWISISLKGAFALIGIGACTQLIWPTAGIGTVKIVAASCCVVFVVLNLLSVKGVGRLQVAMVIGLLAVLGVFLVAARGDIQPERFDGFMAKGFGGMVATAGIVFVSFGGLTKVASVAEEVRRPGRNIPAGLIAAWAVVTLLYVAAVAVMVGVMAPEELAGNLTPMSVAAGKVLGRGGMILVSIGALLAFITTANGGILAASRSPLAMSRDGLLPHRLQTVSRRFGTPHISIALTGVFIIAVIVTLDITTLAKAASTVMLILFAMVNAAVLIMRRSGLQNYRPLYRSPGYPWLQWVGIVVYLAVIVGMGAKPIGIALGFGAVGCLWYLLYVHRRTARESALVYMVKRIVSRKIYRGELDEELKQIALERDEVVADRFDKLVGRCEVLDLHGTLRPADLFEQVADILAPRLGVERAALCDLLVQREAQSSTVIRPGLAIPHIIVDGAGLFDVVLIRCRDGVMFPDSNRLVKMIFVLVGSPDERNYHLRALMTVAGVVSEPGFVRRWLRASGPEHLRDLVLLSKRKREKHELRR